MSYPRPGRVFSRNAHLQVPRLRALREYLANLPGESGSTLSAGKQPDVSPSPYGRPTTGNALARQLFFSFKR